MGRRARPRPGFDRDLSDLPAPLRWREYMMRVEAVIFAASQPVSRETLSALIGGDCNLDLLIADIRDELRSRPYELVDVAGGFQHRTRRAKPKIDFDRALSDLPQPLRWRRRRRRIRGRRIVRGVRDRFRDFSAVGC